MSKHGIVTSEILEGKLSEDCLYAIKSHDYRTGFKPKSKLDKALIVADTLAVIIEKVKRNGELSVERIEEEIERVSKNQPWFKDNFRKIEELGLKVSEILQLGIVR
jgi:predicted hydrolase (HD superfamily)